MLQQFITKLSSTEKKMFYGATLFCALAILDRVFLGPISAQIRNLDSDIKREQGEIKKDLRFLAYKNRILEEQDAFASYFETKSSTEEEMIAEFLKKIEILATEANITLNRVTPTEGKQKKGYREYQASLDCVGELANVVKFIHLLDSSKDLLKTEKLSISAKKSETDEVTVNLMVAKIIVDAAGVAHPADGKQTRSIRIKDLGLGEELNVNLADQPKESTAKQPPPQNETEVKFTISP